MTDSYVYAALLLSKVGKPITGENILGVLQAGSIEANAEQANSLAQALDGVDVAAAIKDAGKPVVSSPPPEAKKEEPKAPEDEAWGIGQGLSDLFK